MSTVVVVLLVLVAAAALFALVWWSSGRTPKRHYRSSADHEIAKGLGSVQGTFDRPNGDNSRF